MNVSIFTKGTEKSSLNVVFRPDSVHLENLVYPDGKAREFHLRLWGKIDAQASSFSLTANKVELRLVKVGGKWPFLLRGEGDAVAGGEEDAPTTKPQSKTEDIPAKPPSYPSSSRTGPKDWDKVVPEDEDEKEDGVNDFFKKLYKSATPEQQRAMMKSFTESNGTSLSTDWNDVKGRTVETVPPEGMEAKRY
ncbi:SGS-domain-containing protein [Ophiocordyceps camponoti-floridani]|uniref:SGS-domain-containing protein n=1 Tax=Ophiocordyceps camponoti-floridani TaxID=2030778 RepID=A0A8H4Q5H3_9HYPO|nr:SGS-domain-containing protein [Ophiocordyceps camponoti-floridani]